MIIEQIACASFGNDGDDEHGSGPNGRAHLDV